MMAGEAGEFKWSDPVSVDTSGRVEKTGSERDGRKRVR